MIHKIREKRSAVATELAKVPREVKPAEAFATVTNLVQEFGQALQAKIKGADGDVGLVNALRDITSTFAQRVACTRPRVTPFTKQQIEHHKQIKLFYRDPVVPAPAKAIDAPVEIDLSDIEVRKRR